MSKVNGSQSVRGPLTGTKIGVVTSDVCDKTRTVAVAFQQRHPKYGKYLLKHTKFHVHDPENASKKGDRVEIAPCRPVSKHKSWRLVRVIEAAPMPRGMRKAVVAATTGEELEQEMAEITHEEGQAAEGQQPQAVAETTPAADSAGEEEKAE